MAGALLSFLSGLTPRQMDRLYRSPWACLAVLRALHPLAKHYVMRLLYVDDGVPIADLDAWVRPEAEETHRACVGDMRRLRVLVVSTGGGDGAASRRGDAAGDAPTAKLSARFARGLRSLYETNFRPDGEQDAAASASASLAALVPSRDALDAFSKGRWEALLLTLTGASDAFSLGDADYAPPSAKKGGKNKKALERPPLDVAALFRAANLVSDAAESSDGEDSGGGVTEAGFRFLLTTAREQIWLLLTRYVERFLDGEAALEEEDDAKKREVSDSDSDSDDDATADRDEDDRPRGAARAASHLAPAVIAFLLRLTFQRPGAPYPADGLPEAQRAVVADLAHLGLLYPFASPDGKNYYVPTELIAGLSGGSGDGEGRRSAGASASSEGHVIVETNYRVYAYTSSAVEVEILRLFTRPDYRLPNLYVGMLTREAVLGALSSGIGAEQIVRYLRAHAHPRTRRTPGPAVPNTVCDQIRLWARERTRVREAPAVLYCDFPTNDRDGMFAEVAKAAGERGVLLWEDGEGARLAVAAEGHEDMKRVFAAARARGEASARR